MKKSDDDTLIVSFVVSYSYYCPFLFCFLLYIDFHYVIFLTHKHNIKLYPYTFHTQTKMKNTHKNIHSEGVRVRGSRMNLEVSMQKVVVFGVMMAVAAARTHGNECSFKAIFNFGDSNSDTGGFYAAFPSERLPFGMTYFKKPAGRATDGRVILDFLGISFHSFSFLVSFI